MKGLSPWAVSAYHDLADTQHVLFELQSESFNFKVEPGTDSLWVRVAMPNGGRVAFRAVFSPGGSLKIFNQRVVNSGVIFKLHSNIGEFECEIRLDTEEQSPVLCYKTTLIPSEDLLIPYWPKDILAVTHNGNTKNTDAKIHASQYGTRTGFIFLSEIRPKSASMIYHQNLTALSEYCEQTESSLSDTVGGEWPELGFSLPVSKKPLLKGVKVVISDALIAFDAQVPEEESAMIKLYLDLLSRVYKLIPKPETKYQQWPDILNKGLDDLINNPGCWSQVAGHKYFNAYVSDYETPPEIMVQLAVLLPLLDYVEWSGKALEVMKTIKEGLPSFYDKKLGTIMRWLPAAEGKLKGEEEQKVPKVMDSWYLHHPLLNLSRLALKGDKVAKDLFLNSLDFAIKVARHFSYRWPVFYKMDTLEVVKAETAEGKGGEKDVAGIYAHVMLQAWELTQENRYLKEAELAAKTLKGNGFEVFYQANNTAFAAGALLRLYKITKNERYLDLSYMCLASIFRNVQLWDCNYGYGKHFPKFFSMYPLNDAPYTAAYEEQEVFCALHDYLKHAEGIDILSSVKMLLAEFIRYIVDRAVYYYPTMLPGEMLEEKPKIGEIDRKLWIALEDLQDGWLKSGTVGQEVYGAGNAFGILPRHFIQIPGASYMIYVDYPTSSLKAEKGRPLKFKVLGDSSMTCRMMLVKTGNKKIPPVKVVLSDGDQLIAGKTVKSGNIEYLINGNSNIEIR